MAVVSKSDFLKDHKGVTLMEMLLVVVILGILATLTLPSTYNMISGHRLDSAAKEIVSEMRKGQQLAISKEAIATIIFNDSVSSPANTFYVKIKKDGVDTLIKKLELSNDIKIYKGKKFYFYPDGGTRYSDGTVANATIRLEGKDGKSISIIVFYTGRIRISK